MKNPLKKKCVYAKFPHFRNIFEWYPTNISTVLLSIIRHIIQNDHDTTYSAEKSDLRYKTVLTPLSVILNARS